MQIQKSEILPIRSAQDVVIIRQKVRGLATEVRFGLVDQTKVVTAASELARNTLDYGGGGQVVVEILSDGVRAGLKMVFEDKGPGIPDIELALRDGYTTGGGLGMGLSGSRRLMSEFSIDSKVGEGTRVTVVKWK